MFPFWILNNEKHYKPDLRTNLRAFKAVALMLGLVAVIFIVFYVVMFV